MIPAVALACAIASDVATPAAVDPKPLALGLRATRRGLSPIAAAVGAFHHFALAGSPKGAAGPNSGKERLSCRLSLKLDLQSGADGSAQHATWAVVHMRPAKRSWDSFPHKKTRS